MKAFFKISFYLILLSIFGCQMSSQEPLDLEKAPIALPQSDNSSSAPLEATFESINKNVFLKTCKDCHNENGTGKRVLLDKDSLIDSLLQLIIPGNPGESGLVVDLERKDDKRMPPAEDGYAALPESTIAVIRKWIENGAKD